MTRAHGAGGSAFGSQPKGRGFESPWVHQIFLKRRRSDSSGVLFYFPNVQACTEGINIPNKKYQSQDQYNPGDWYNK